MQMLRRHLKMKCIVNNYIKNINCKDLLDSFSL